ncbi:auxin-responsive protein IAA18-like isoform X2 [Abrus precatorius]|uniref:Auxin-induced protein n=1 Tax=Abrus precatorius TaxID=3816 RepID=A0A8B8K1D0_ABRPR|nr:auxin-responsive protein IAA18-like isoform X2 [Abrus precatorius]
MWQRNHKSSEERKLELRLGPPGEESLNESIKNGNIGRDESSSLPLGYFSTQKISTSDKPGPGGVILPPVWPSTSYHHHSQHQAKASSFLRLPSSPKNMLVMGKDVSQPCCLDLQVAEKKEFRPSSSYTAVSKRNASGPVVGWPPIRSFRKNIASGSSSKLPSGSQQHHQHVVPDKFASHKPTHNSGKGLFVKINMDGVPIGRKVDISAYDSYEKLSSAVDELFRGLLSEMNLSHIISSRCCSAQRDSSASGIQNKEEEEKMNMGLLVGSGEYTLVYEDNEGDRMLVGDVPWHEEAEGVEEL